MDIDAIHLPIEIACLTGIGLWIMWAFMNKKRWLYAILPLTYLIHTFLFMEISEMNLLTKYEYNVWTDAVRLHGLLVLILACVGMILVERNRWIHKR